VIRLRTLGSIDLQSHDGKALGTVLAQPKRLALLVYLALARPCGFHRRDRLLAMFWPEQDATHARDSLNQAIRFLRQALGSDVVVSRGTEEIGLDRTRFVCDAIDFQTAIDQGRDRDAIELYHGDFLDGFFVVDSRGFEEWVEAERARLREQACHSARLLAEQEEACGHVTRAVRWGRLAVTLSDGDERALRRWLTLLARVGDRAAAIQAYDAFARRLREDLDAEPSPETQALVETIRRQAAKAPAPHRPPMVAARAHQDASDAPASRFAQGSMLANGWYIITHEIGAGGMATVYAARDVRHDRWVVVKVLRPEVALTVGIDDFFREIRIAARLQHPHIVPVFDSGTTDGRPYFVMPLMEGESLRSRLEHNGPLPLGAALRIAHEVADALAYAHKQGIVHLDIKPDNLLLAGEPGTDTAHALVADFGISRAIARSSADSRSGPTGVVIGSPAYMSPEQAMGDALDGRSDVYSLGCVLYEMLAGKAPFSGPNARALIARHVLEPVPNIRAVRPAIPEDVRRTIERAMSKSPSDRFAQASELAAALGAAEHAWASVLNAG
jgi:DNA-binding SARP family transcriptional activator